MNGTSFLYRPLLWARSVKRFRTSILKLERKLGIIYLTPLNIGIKTLHVTLNQTPQNCLSKLQPEQFEANVRDFLLHNFQSPSTNGTREGLQYYENICNMRSRRKDGDISEIYFDCCHLTSTDDIQCHELDTEGLVEVLLNCIRAAKYLVVLFVPLLIPKSYFKPKFKEIPFEHPLPSSLSFTMMLSTKSDTMDSKRRVTLETLRQTMPKFYKTCTSNELQENVLYKITITKLEFNVNSKRLISRFCAPVGILSTFYNNFILCKLRNKEPFIECCKSSCSCGRLSCTMYKCCRSLTTLLFAFIIFSPWICRVLIYYIFEDQEYRNQHEHVHSHGMSTQITGDLVTDLTPAHPVFMVSYVFLGLSFLMLSVTGLLNPFVLYPIQSIIRKCFRDIYKSSTSKLLKWCGNLMIKPMSTSTLRPSVSRLCAIPVTLMILPFYILPTVNFVVRLVVYSLLSCLPSCKQFSEKEQELQECPNRSNDDALPAESSPGDNDENNVLNEDDENTKLHKFDIFGLAFLFDKDCKDIPKPAYYTREATKWQYACHPILLFVCFLSTLATLFLAALCIIFCVEWVIYSIIGIILNSKSTFKYVTFVFMVVLYFQDCFGSVPRKFESFNKEIHDLVVTRIKDEI